MRLLYLLLVMCVVLFVWSLPSKANASECGKHDKVVSFLERKYKEVLVGGGMVNRSSYMEMYASENGKSWTILLTNTKGISCVVLAGETFYRAKLKPVEDPEA